MEIEVDELSVGMGGCPLGDGNKCIDYGCGAILQDCRRREIKFKPDFYGKAWCPYCGANAECAESRRNG